jgi:phosphoenolpyruvate phosphomutase
MSKAMRLREFLDGSRVAVAIGAHDGLSARLIADAGFDAIWASGFGIAATHAVPDANVLTMTETLDATRAMVAASRIPVVADCDSGYGNAINVIRTVREFSREGAAGICLEDNDFPKRCSFYGGVRRSLVTIQEHAEKIRAARDARVDRDFVIISRTEAFIAGEGLEMALQRAHAYADAGADAILVHSKAKDYGEIRSFADRWNGRLPLVAVPTTYGSVSLEELQVCGVRLVIFANQVLRSSIRSIRETLATLREDPRPAAVDDTIVPLSDVYELVGLPELQANEREYMAGEEPPEAIIIAAGFEGELMPLNRDRPKGMLDVRGDTILARQIRGLRECGVRSISIVRGHMKDAIDFEGVRTFDNPRYQETGELYSLFCASEAMTSRFLFLYSDLLFDPVIVERLLRAEGDVVLVVDRAIRDQPLDTVLERNPDLVVTEGDHAASYRFLPSGSAAAVHAVGRKIEPGRVNGEFIGIASFSPQGAQWAREVWEDLRARPGRVHEADSSDRASFTDLVQELIERGRPVCALDIYKGWMEINTLDDYRRAWDFIGNAADGSANVRLGGS